ncbi:MAG: hypothetical protein DRR03_03795 [Gammaproteobacteria bacterium]|nr:MAG: hypothetical protein DRR03_03795 [Gammaproteobacteria bacterium]
MTRRTPVVDQLLPQLEIVVGVGRKYQDLVTMTHLQADGRQAVPYRSVDRLDGEAFGITVGACVLLVERRVAEGIVGRRLDPGRGRRIAKQQARPSGDGVDHHLGHLAVDRIAIQPDHGEVTTRGTRVDDPVPGARADRNTLIVIVDRQVDDVPRIW